MPFPRSLSHRNSYDRQQDDLFKHLTNMVCRKMAAVGLTMASSPLHGSSSLAPRARRRITDVIDISSDDDMAVPVHHHHKQPTSSKIKGKAPAHHVNSDDESRDDSDEYDLHVPHPKRAKIRHGSSNLLKLPHTGHERVRKSERPRTPAPAAPESHYTGQSHTEQANSTLLPQPVIEEPCTRQRQSLTQDDTLSQHQPPYYYDAGLQVQMYRGRGYELFPVALGTVDGHNEMCQEWDAQRLRRPHPGHIQMQEDGRNGLNGAIDKAPSEMDQKCLHQILEVLPDLDHNFALAKITDFNVLISQLNDNAQDYPAMTHIVSQILEKGDYPKESTKMSTKSSQDASLDGTGITIKYKKSATKNGSYLKDAIMLLAVVFGHIPTHYIAAVVTEKQSIFESYIHLTEAESTYYTHEAHPYTRLRQPRKTLEKKYQIRHSWEQRDTEQYLQMVNELQAAKQHTARQELRQENLKKTDEVEATNLEIHRASGSLVQCQCCFDDEVPINRTVSCEGDNIHFYCSSCIVSHADNQIGLMRYEMNCMHTDGCTAPLSTAGIAQAVPLKTFDRLALNQQQAEISAAGIEGLEQCPFCDFKAICEPMEQNCIFDCQNLDCGRTTCRRCKEDAHVPKTCKENKNDRGLSARHLVEEARTEAVTRPCPKCGVKIVKELGCNKMVCTQCRTTMCYICKANISDPQHGGYHHFHRPGAKCKLQDDPGADRHEQEADEAEKEAIKKAKADNAELDEEELQIETGADKEREKKKQMPRPLQHDYMAMGYPPDMGRPFAHPALNLPQDYRRQLAVQREHRNVLTQQMERVGVVNVAPQQQQVQQAQLRQLRDQIAANRRKITGMMGPRLNPRPNPQGKDNMAIHAAQQAYNGSLSPRLQAAVGPYLPFGYGAQPEQQRPQQSTPLANANLRNHLAHDYPFPLLNQVPQRQLPEIGHAGRRNDFNDVFEEFEDLANIWGDVKRGQ